MFCGPNVAGSLSSVDWTFWFGSHRRTASDCSECTSGGGKDYGNHQREEGPLSNSDNNNHADPRAGSHRPKYPERRQIQIMEQQRDSKTGILIVYPVDCLD